MIKIAICDDEQLVRDYIENILRRKYGDGIVISHYEKAESLLEAWEQADNREDIVLMDIRLTQMDGISAAQNLQEKHHNVKIIFITGYIDYATEIFRAEPIYFLIKPVREEKLIEAVEKAKTYMKKECSRMLVCNLKGVVVKVDIDQIYYLESDRRVSYVYEEKRTIALNQKLKELEKQLPDSFLRCHQSFLVNMQYIRSFSGQEIELVDGRKIPVSRPKYAAARETFLKYLGDVV